jgi:hypothetical protein
VPAAAGAIGSHADDPDSSSFQIGVLDRQRDRDRQRRRPQSLRGTSRRHTASLTVESSPSGLLARLDRLF